MKHIFISLFLFCGFVLSGAVTIMKLPNDSHANERWRIENEYVMATFSSKGGAMVQLVDKKSGKELVGEEGAFRDQFPPNNKEFAETSYTGKIISSNPREAVLELTAPALEGANKFTGITKRYSLKDSESLLRVEVVISNQTESMTSRIFEYWSHSFFGIPDTRNDFFIPLENGVHREESGSNRFFKEPVRGWIAMIGSKSGIVLLPAYSRFQLAYSWNCLGANKRNTLEFRQIGENTPAGQSHEIRFAAGIFDGLDSIHGGGEAGCGSLTLEGRKLHVDLRGFRDVQAEAVLRVDGKKVSSRTVILKTHEFSAIDFDLGMDGSRIVVELTDKSGDILFDLYMPLKTDAVFAALEKRISPPVDGDPWHFVPKTTYKTPYFQWLNNTTPFDAMFLLETNGLRDVIELRQRMNFNFEAPTVFPSSWTMSWRRKTSFAPASGGETGTDKVLPFLKKHYDMIVMGGGLSQKKVNGRFIKASSWKAYPQKVRDVILGLVKDGTGLVLLNPEDTDPALDKVLAGLEKNDSLFSDSMSFSAAPYFPDAEILTGKYGKGRVAVVKFKTDCFLAPVLKTRHRHFQMLSCDHRFQEYQFAILARIINWARGSDPVILSLNPGQNGSVVLKTSVSGDFEFESFNRYSESIGKFTKKLEEGTNTVKIPDLTEGISYLHARLPGKDFAFVKLQNSSPKKISSIEMKDWYGKGEHVRGTVHVSPEAKALRLKVEIRDGTGRLVWRGNRPDFDWDQHNAVVNRHFVQAELLDGKRVVSILRKDFHLPETFDLTRGYANLLWVGADMFPEYTYPERYEQLRSFGFNFLYGGMFSDASSLLLRYANVETGMNWYAGSRGLHLTHEQIQKNLECWYKTQKKEYLIRKPCLNDPGHPPRLPGQEPQFTAFCSRHLFQFGDEMSMTYYQFPIDVCFCKYCLSGFRQWLRDSGLTLDRLNETWKTSFKSWDEVMPQTFNETLFQPSPAGFVAHRLYMDKVFADTLKGIQTEIQKKYPDALAGPTGVLNSPHPYGGNWNFWNMSDFDCASFYGIPRIPVSFNREKRFIMSYRGYDSPQGEIRSSFWEGLFAGERNSNNWSCPIFLLPDLRRSEVRAYYSDILWELRSGPGDLLFHAKKYTSQAAILHSQNSLISNFLKTVKTDYFKKETSFARVLEDLGFGYRFIAPEELTAECLHDFKVLILPEASALSDKEIEVIRNFVRAGGKLIADYEPGTQFENCVSRPAPALNSLFGISTGRQVLRKVISHDLNGITIRNALSGVVCKDGKPLGEAVTKHGKVPLAIVNGNVMYLNFEPVYESKHDKAFRDLIGNFVGIKSPGLFESESPVMHSYYTDGKNLYIALLADPSFPDWRNSTADEARKYTISGSLKLASEAFLYDVRQGKFLGKGSSFALNIVPGDGTLLAALPYKVKEISLKAPSTVSAGDTAEIEACVRTDGNVLPENHVMLMRVFRPDGSESLDYRKIEKATQGKFTFRFPSALDDKGKWRLTVKDAATGIASSCSITVQ